jgi:type V secretory pathway adhesin AidA
MIRNRFLFAFLLLFFTACGTPAQAVYPTQKPDSIQACVNANASKGTAVAAVATANYFSNQLTAMVETRNQIGTQQAMEIQSQATERAWNATVTADSIQSTSAASGTASAVAQQAAWTQRTMDITATADTASVQAFATEHIIRPLSTLLSNFLKVIVGCCCFFTPCATMQSPNS